MTIRFVPGLRSCAPGARACFLHQATGHRMCTSPDIIPSLITTLIVHLGNLVHFSAWESHQYVSPLAAWYIGMQKKLIVSCRQLWRKQIIAESSFLDGVELVVHPQMIFCIWMRRHMTGCCLSANS